MEVSIGALVVIGAIIFAICEDKGQVWFAKANAKIKWQALQEDIEKIERIEYSLTKEKNIFDEAYNWLDKNLIRQRNKSLAESKEKYMKYLEYCESKNIELPAHQREVQKKIETAEKLLKK